MEEVLTGETAEDAAALAKRCAQLSTELEGTPGDTAETVLKTLALPDVASVRAILVPECPVSSASVDAEGIEQLVMGVADALVPALGAPPYLVIDWRATCSHRPASCGATSGSSVITCAQRGQTEDC